MTDMEKQMADNTTAPLTGLERLALRRQRDTTAQGRVNRLTQAVDFRVRLRLLRRELGLTQAEAGRISGVTQADISRIENGEVNPSIDRMNRILTQLGNHRAAVTVPARAAALGGPLIDAVDAAAYLRLIRDREDSFTHLKLQKLLYYAQGYALAIWNKLLFADPLLAWEHGPVVDRVWRTHTQYGAAPLPRPEGFDPFAQDDQARGILERVYVELGQFESWRLREMTHQEPPWAGTPQNEEIPIEVLAAYFAERLSQQI